MKRTANKVHKLLTRSCDRMCDGGDWTKADHKLLVDTVDALNDEIRDMNHKLHEVAGMAHMDLAISAARYADRLREERREFVRIREGATKRNRCTWEIKQSMQGELFKGAP